MFSLSLRPPDSMVLVAPSFHLSGQMTCTPGRKRKGREVEEGQKEGWSAQNKRHGSAEKRGEPRRWLLMTVARGRVEEPARGG